MSMDDIDRHNIEWIQQAWFWALPVLGMTVANWPFDRWSKRRVLQLFNRYISGPTDGLRALRHVQFTLNADEYSTKWASNRMALLRLSNPGNHLRYQDRVSITRTKPIGSGVNRLKRSRRRA